MVYGEVAKQSSQPNRRFMLQDSALCSQFWEGFSVSFYQQEDNDLHIYLTPDDHSPLICSQCEQPAISTHDTCWRKVRERDLFDLKVFLHLPVRRVACLQCGPKVQHISWLARGARLTLRLQTYAESLSKILPIKHVAELLQLSWHTVKNIDKNRLNREVKEPQWPAIKHLVMDEFALFKGHRYATVVADADTHQVLWVGVGRSREQIRPFFEWMGDHCQHIEAVAMDMNTAFDLEVKQHCPNASIVYDLFHVVAKYGREVIDRVRVDEANRLREDKTARKWVKRSRWILLKNRDNMNAEQQLYLEELLAANRSLNIVYLLKEQLKELWYCSSPEQAKELWAVWWRQVQESGIASLQQFARRLRPYLAGIVSSATYRLHTSRLEGINNKIKVIKRMAYGYRDTEYFFLKIKAAFPGVRR